MSISWQGLRANRLHNEIQLGDVGSEAQLSGRYVKPLWVPPGFVSSILAAFLYMRVCVCECILTAVGLATCACVGKLDAMLVHTPTDTHRVVALCGLVESLNIAVRCVGA